MNILLYLYTDAELTEKMQELLNITSLWKKVRNGKIYVVMLEEKAQKLKQKIEEWNIDKIFLLENDSNFSLQKTAVSFKEILKKIDIDSIVMGNSIFERELAPYLTALLHWKFIPNITSFEFQNENIIWKRFLYGTKAIEEITAKETSTVITVSSSIYNKDERTGLKQNTSTEKIFLEMKKKEWFVLKSREIKIFQKHPLESARIVIGVGKGIKGKENFPMIEELAELLGATIGVTRSVVDNGWRPEYEKIGQTGKIIKPELYLGFGISGAMQHMAGVQQSRHIVMINNNPNAESFRSSDFGITADLFDIIPRLIKYLKKRK